MQKDGKDSHLSVADTLVLSTSEGLFGCSARLRLPNEFKRVFSEANRSSGPAFTVLARVNVSGNANEARLGLAIAKKHAARAVDRNRIKRLVRESFRKQRSMMGGIDIVVLNRRDTHKIQNSALYDELTRHWKRVTHLCEAS